MACYELPTYVSIASGGRPVSCWLTDIQLSRSTGYYPDMMLCNYRERKKKKAFEESTSVCSWRF